MAELLCSVAGRMARGVNLYRCSWRKQGGRNAPGLRRHGHKEVQPMLKEKDLGSAQVWLWPQTLEAQRRNGESRRESEMQDAVSEETRCNHAQPGSARKQCDSCIGKWSCIANSYLR